MIGVLGSLAEYERELIKERSALKRASSRANGTRFGRPRKVESRPGTARRDEGAFFARINDSAVSLAH
jgi:DNA invertase Pin-like site-specific DNA recombinase